LIQDIDILWFRNPMRHIAITSDIAIASDYFNGDPDSLHNLPKGKSQSKRVDAISLIMIICFGVR